MKMIRNTSPGRQTGQRVQTERQDTLCSQHNNPTYTTYLTSYKHTYISADGPVLCCIVLYCIHKVHMQPKPQGHIFYPFQSLVFCLLRFYFTFYLFFCIKSMILGGADVSFFCVLFWGQPDSGLVCLVSFLNSNEKFEFCFFFWRGGREEGRKGGSSM